MRKILFLDFDGVLHSDTCREYFTKIDLLEKYLKQMPTLEIVISSAWRGSYDLDELKIIFSKKSLANRVVGITPILDCSFQKGGRQLEIQKFLEDEKLDQTNASWRALDDIAQFFYDDCPFLIKVDSAVGFSDKEGQALLQWYQAT